MIGSRSKTRIILDIVVVAFHWVNYRIFMPAMIEQCWQDLFRLYDEGNLRPVIGGTYNMESVADAIGHLASRKAFGKIVMEW